jgi:hypothetical protein
MLIFLKLKATQNIDHVSPFPMKVNLTVYVIGLCRSEIVSLISVPDPRYSCEKSQSRHVTGFLPQGGPRGPN